MATKRRKERTPTTEINHQCGGLGEERRRAWRGGGKFDELPDVREREGKGLVADGWIENRTGRSQDTLQRNRQFNAAGLNRKIIRQRAVVGVIIIVSGRGRLVGIGGGLGIGRKSRTILANQHQPANH